MLSKEKLIEKYKKEIKDLKSHIKDMHEKEYETHQEIYLYFLKIYSIIGCLESENKITGSTSDIIKKHLLEIKNRSYF